MASHKCLWTINSLYVEKTALGYKASPCCLWDEEITPSVEKIEELQNNPFTDSVRKRFKKDWKRPQCQECVVNEDLGKTSKRQRSLKRSNNGKIVDWDIRPGNTCNLKCIMCNPFNSSKWMEDEEIWLKYGGFSSYQGDMKAREKLDWDWIYENCIDSAERIYIAGGEPFYMKSVRNFLERLSQHEWNRENTRIVVQTNSVSNTPNLIDTLSKYKRLEFGISIDGWAEVNELIRFPTQHDVFLQNCTQLLNLSSKFSFFNITVQALNLLDVDRTVAELGARWPQVFIDKHLLVRPSQLSINSLKPHVIEQAKNTTDEMLLKFLDTYEYNPKKNERMKNFLLEMDQRRGTDSKKISPWCFE